ncbi:hypothetical protein OIE69_44280 (plasmid) [Actinacidiphila glaucinigra]|uniref:hypothetical protein n=1 Tax=Actinacidiphila glaucinigra TaxID=235986 RepID=UPI002DD7C8ED|nr:hypothetical protein [Actinacidiphila glaucinigra]WSD65923.1 hypothetical protein OIE69_44280 [Actinacidiphila glaucinigra]
MDTTLTPTPPAEAIVDIPGHALVLQETHADLYAGGCTCGGFLEPLPMQKAEQVRNFLQHRDESVNQTI